MYWHGDKDDAEVSSLRDRDDGDARNSFCRKDNEFSFRPIQFELPADSLADSWTHQARAYKRCEG